MKKKKVEDVGCRVHLAVQAVEPVGDLLRVRVSGLEFGISGFGISGLEFRI